MMRAAIAAALTAVSGFGTTVDNDWPPYRFREVGIATVQFVRSQNEIDHLCGAAPKHFVTEGCTRDDEVIVLPDPCEYTGEFARIACHENAHRFGAWPRNHPR
jgi:hypothetical protein